MQPERLVRQALRLSYGLDHLNRDPGETRDVAAENPDVAAALEKRTLAWDQSMPPVDSWDYLVPSFEKYFRLTMKDTFDKSPLGGRPQRCTVYTENKGDSIVISGTEKAEYWLDNLELTNSKEAEAAAARSPPRGR